MKRKSWLFWGWVVPMVFLLYIVWRIMPGFVQEGIEQGLLKFGNLLVDVTATIVVYAGPGLLAFFGSLLMKTSDAFVDPNARFLSWQRYVLYSILTLTIGASWLVVPTYLVTGWNEIFVSFFGYEKESVHWVSAVWALVSAYTVFVRNDQDF